MSEQTIVGTDVAVPAELVQHTFRQGSWPWLFQSIIENVSGERLVPLDPVILFWPSDVRGDRPLLADADTGSLPDKLLDPAFFSLRIVSRRDGESIVRGWPGTRDWKFRDVPLEPEPEPLKPLTWEAAAARRRSPFDVE